MNKPKSRPVKQAKTGEKKRKPGTFVPGDPRINRLGRPKTHDKLEELIQAIAAMPSTQGNSLIAEKILQMLLSHDPRDSKEILEHGWGKPKEKVEQSGELVIRIVRSDKDSPA